MSIVHLDWGLDDIGLGMVVRMPFTHKEFVNGVKQKKAIEMWIWLGPLKVHFGGHIEIFAYTCAMCHYQHTGAPAMVGPLPGLVVCRDCISKPGLAEVRIDSRGQVMPSENDEEDERDDTQIH